MEGFFIDNNLFALYPSLKGEKMAKILFTSDLHLTKDLLRITECLNFLDYIKKYCLQVIYI